MGEKLQLFFRLNAFYGLFRIIRFLFITVVVWGSTIQWTLAMCSLGSTRLDVNGGFETPLVTGTPPNFNQIPQAAVPGWTTTDSQGEIELWDTGFLGVDSDTGVQHAELNANSPGNLTQTGTVSSRAELLYFWAHRARSAAVETASLTITDNAGGSTVFGDYSSGTAAWNNFSAIHLASVGATSFSAAHSTVLGGSVGNFHDSIQACQTFITFNKTELSRQDLQPPAGDSAGDTVTYRFTISNPAGNERSLTNVVINDDQIGTINVPIPASGDVNGNSLLDPGESWVSDVPYTLAQADLDAGSVVNVAFAESDTPDNTLRTDDATVTASLSVATSFQVTKVASASGFTTGNIQEAPAGTVVTYTYEVTNIGNQTISNITLNDVHLGTGTPAPIPGNETLGSGSSANSTDAITNDGIWSVLVPGDTVVFTSTYTITQSDIDTLQ